MKKAIIRKPKQSVNRKTASEMFVINKKYLGEEPSFMVGYSLSDGDLTRAFNWYNYMQESSDAYNYILDYLKNSKEHNLISLVKDAKYIPNSIGWSCRLLSNGYMIDSIDHNHIVNRIKLLEQKEKEIITDNVVEFKSVKKVDTRLSELDDILEERCVLGERYDHSKFNMWNWIQSKECSRSDVQKYKDLFMQYVNEYEEVVKNTDSQIKEAYAKYSRKFKKDSLEFFKKIVIDCDRFLLNKKAMRKPRKKKVITTDKILQHFVYKKDDNTFKLSSINPEKILQSTELYLFNTKNNVLTRLVAIDDCKFNIHRTAITNVNEEKSTSKRIGRKTEMILANLLNCAKIPTRKAFDEIKTSSLLQTRMNSETIILKVY